jgi:hypothetical protein
VSARACFPAPSKISALATPQAVHQRWAMRKLWSGCLSGPGPRLIIAAHCRRKYLLFKAYLSWRGKS